MEIMWGIRLLDEGFTSVPNLVIRSYRKLGIEHGEWGFICQLLTYKHDARDPYPSRRELADHLCCSERQIDKWVKSLRGKGLLKTGRRRNVHNKQWDKAVYSFRPLLDACLALVGEQGLPPAPEEFEIFWDDENEPHVPEVRMDSVPEVRMDRVPEVRTKKKSKKENLKELIDCRGEIAAASESIEIVDDPIYKALNENASICMIEDEVSLKQIPTYIGEIYIMLHKQFQYQLLPEIVERACQLFSERAYDWRQPFKMKIDLQNPVGYFHMCYKDAVKEYKASTTGKSRKGVTT